MHGNGHGVFQRASHHLSIDGSISVNLSVNPDECLQASNIDVWQCFEKRVYACQAATKHHRQVLSGFMSFHTRQFTNN